MSETSDLDEERWEMVERQIAGRGVRSQAPPDVSRLAGLRDTYPFGL